MRKLIIGTIVCGMLFTACGKKEEAGKNIEQIQKEQGIPVRVADIELKTFVQELTYNAPLNGIEETTAKSMVSDIVQKINAKVGDRVNKDQVIVVFPSNTPTAQYEQARTAYQNAKNLYERMQRLYSQGAISQQDFDNVETGYKVSKANFETTSQMVNVKAGITGMVTSILVNPSERVNYGQDLFTIANTNRLKGILWIPESDIKNVKKGMKATANWNDVTIDGKVTQVSLTLDNNNKAFRAEVEFPNPSNKIPYGVTVKIGIEIAKIENAIVVERKSIVEENGDKYVWLAVNNKSIKRQITVGHDNQLEYEVLTGLSVGEKLIIEGINQLTDNTLIHIIQ